MNKFAFEKLMLKVEKTASDDDYYRECEDDFVANIFDMDVEKEAMEKDAVGIAHLKEVMSRMATKGGAAYQSHSPAVKRKLKEYAKNPKATGAAGFGAGLGLAATT
jgi:hypothetical protein